jgi:biotin-dependent carboxylase-like uncharacterized protein
MSLTVKQAGMLSLLQDAGRYGKHDIGLTTGGPMDSMAFRWANQLLSNELASTAIEVTVGGLELEAAVNTFIVVTGAKVPLTINDDEKALWQVHAVSAGDIVRLGFATEGMRAYLSVAGGFKVEGQFGSTATVSRESIGGFDGGPLKIGDVLACDQVSAIKKRALAKCYQPEYQQETVLRVVLGYQQNSFSEYQQWRFFNNEYSVSARCDRMGFRLEGAEISCDINGILSEGICFGAIQIPADGQPIVLLNDRQTIGGYPKIGSVLSIDCAKLAQLPAGSKVRFEAIDIYQAQNLIHLAHSQFQRTPMDDC